MLPRISIGFGSERRMGRSLFLILASTLLLAAVPAMSQVLVPFTQRTTPPSFKIRGDFAMIGNTNMTLLNYTNTSNNAGMMIYVDIDGVDSTFNSSSATLQFSTENGADPQCSDVLFAGLYWTGRTHDMGANDPIPNSFSVTKQLPTDNFVTQADDYTVEHNDDIPDSNFGLTVNRGGPSGNRYPIFIFSDGTDTYTFNFTNSGGADRVTLSVNGDPAVNVPVTYSNAGNTGTAVLTTPYVITDGGVTITITRLVRDSRTDRSQDQYRNSSEADVTVSQQVPELVDVTKTLNRRNVLFRVPGGSAYEQIEADALDIYYPATNSFSQGMYSAFADVTAQVQAAGPGEYFVADVAIREGDGGGTGYYGGWGMVVVYENYLMIWRDITIFDGHAFVNASVGSSQIEVSGFQTTPAGAVNLRIGVMAGEGDAGIQNNYLEIRDATDDNWVRLSHAGNTTNNFFNSSIQTGGNPRNPNLINNTGLDISAFTVNNPGNSILANGQTSTRFRYGSDQDAYCIFNITMSSDSYVPEAEGLIAVTEINGSDVIPDPLVVGPGDQIQYTIEIRNIGTEAVFAHAITIPIPYTGMFVPGSIVTNVFFAPLPTPNNIYFDPNEGPTGSIIWDFGTLPLPDDPSELLASLTFTIEVYDNCLLLSDDVCSDAIIAIGSLTGTGELTGVGILNNGLITGYVQDGPCQGEPITDPLSAAIEVPENWVADNCAPEQLESDFYFCDGNPTVPVSAVAPSFPLGTRFFNEYPVVEGVSTEYTATFPAVAGSSVTYYAVPPIPEDDECNIAITINICEDNTDLAITKDVSDATPDVGDNVVFTLSVTNNGVGDATGVTVNDLLPSGYSYVSDNGAGAYNSGTGVWTIGDLANGASTTLTITAEVLTTGDYRNIARVTGAEIDPDLTNNVDGAEVVPNCDIRNVTPSIEN
jgi:uncharacterized repeat protein (TIGR01451 family)